MKFQKLLLLFFYIFTLSFCAAGQNAANEGVAYSLRSPYQTVYTHLKYLQPDSYEPSISAKTFNLQDAEEAEELAIKLKQVLDARGLFVDMEALPKDPDYIDSVTNRQRYVLFDKVPEIAVEKVEDQWYYSRQTVAAIPVMHSEVFPFGSDFLVNLFPGIGHREVMGLELWQHFGLLFIILIAVVLHFLLTGLIGFFIRRFAGRAKIAQDEEYTEVTTNIAKPLSLLVVTFIILLLIPIVQLPVRINQYTVLALRALMPFFGMIFFYKLVDLLSIYLKRAAEKTESTLDDQLIPLVSKTLKIFVVAVGVIFILQNLNFNIAALLAGISIGGLAFALAAQDTLKNFFGSIMIFLDRPFQIGDWINFDGSDGTVEEVGFRSTRVRTFANSLISIPNGKIADMKIDNLGLRVYRRFKAEIALTYDTPPDLIDEYVKGLRELVKAHPQTRKDYFEIHLNSMGDFSLNVLFYIFFDVPSWSDELKARHEVLLAVIRLAEHMGLRFAFPTRTLHMEDFPGKESLTPSYEKVNRETAKEMVDKFISGYRF